MGGLEKTMMISRFDQNFIHRVRGKPKGGGKMPLPPGMRRIGDVLRGMKLDGDQKDGGAHDGNTPGQ